MALGDNRTLEYSSDTIEGVVGLGNSSNRKTPTELDGPFLQEIEVLNLS